MRQSEIEPVQDAPATSLLFRDPRPAHHHVAVPVETPVEIVFAGIPFAVMMLTPADLADFGLGFCLTEGIAERRDDVRNLRIETIGEGVRLDIELSPDRMSRHLARRRAISGRTGCGICGVEDMASLERSTAPIIATPRVALTAIQQALAGLETQQSLNARTRAVHAAAWADNDGRVTHVREDVGRHNAIDKLIGALLAADAKPANGFILITSRCSFEMVDKAAAFGAGLLVAISAPTSLALERARRLGMALVGIARGDGITIFLGQDSILNEAVPA